LYVDTIQVIKYRQFNKFQIRRKFNLISLIKRGGGTVPYEARQPSTFMLKWCQFLQSKCF